ncbi:MAG: hypothetical protein ACU836_06530 [Gammaproteobacteria bacterium]
MPARFVSVSVLPGLRRIKNQKTYILSKTQAGSSSTSIGSCTCTEQQTKDKKKQKVCEKTMTTSTPYRVTAQDEICRIFFEAESGMHYAAFIRDERLMLQPNGAPQPITPTCRMQSPYSYDTTDTSSTTNRCAP